MKIDEFLDFFDFSYEKHGEKYSLIDMQNANLGDIESEIFNSIQELVERFIGSIYEQDYILRDLEEEFQYNGDCSIKDMYVFSINNNISYSNILYAMCNPKTVTI